MKRFAAAALAASLLAAPAAAEPVAYTFDMSHSAISFTFNHLGFSTTEGRFGEWTGELVIDQETPSNSSVDVTVDVTSLNTFWADRDAHLKSADMFEVEKHPAARFTSTKVEKTGENTLAVTGDLTIKDITKPLVLDVTVNKMGEHPVHKQPGVGLTATGVIKRSDYGVDYAVPYVSDEIPVTINVEALKAQD
ncbi:YceI family protein [Rhizobiales bacterium]|uniref:YceI family protein n=1 Tax=Hongsoonwoonella zoysiae TaxID=2821844 RepID=UPI001560FD18|nr:YceI family protein [Hongsoonwoonella zoysiae]NRG18469.1 YceI family protein [Hongsoonwoonella zoysiae]